MPKIEYFPVGFNPVLGSRLLSPGFVSFSWARLLWSAITVGRASWNKVLQHGMYSAFEIIYRASMLLANLEESPTKKLAQSTAYIDLDPSEKSAISYFIGLTSAKLLAQRLLGVNWLMHLDVYKHLLSPGIMGGSRPDLVGVDRSLRWIAIEAKGRTHGISSNDKAGAKGQVDQLVSVRNMPVSLGIGLISYFNSGNKLEVFLQDPNIVGKGSNLGVAKDDFFRDYYRMFVDLIKSGYGEKKEIQVRGRSYLIKYVMEVDAIVGIDKEVYLICLEDSEDVGALSQIPSILPKMEEPLAVIERDRPQERKISKIGMVEDSTDDPVVVGEDGVYVELGNSWFSQKRKGVVKKTHATQVKTQLGLEDVD